MKQRSIGIECINFGPMIKNKPIEKCGWNTVMKLKGPDDRDYYYAIPDIRQMNALTDLCTDLCEKFKTIKYIASHYQLSENKIDPDPPFDLKYVATVVSTSGIGRKIELYKETK
jgi:N-acetyl-anhydromuramyl-L-alanine amidase AmpD